MPKYLNFALFQFSWDNEDAFVYEQLQQLEIDGKGIFTQRQSQQNTVQYYCERYFGKHEINISLLKIHQVR